MRIGTEKRWFVPAIIVLALICFFGIIANMGKPSGVNAQLKTFGEDRITVFPVQLERNTAGIVMVDKVDQTLWIYRINNSGPAHNRLELLAARSWKYDRLLQQYNSAEPKPEQIRLLLEQLGQLQKTQESDEEKLNSDKSTSGNESERR